MTPDEIRRKLNIVLPTVQKPGRYTGGELNQIEKDWDNTPIKVALAFPDVYDLGMANLGLAIFYDILNGQDDVLAERVYAPWTDMEQAMRKEGIPLYSLETRHPLSDFDLIGISLPYETLYTNTLNMLDLGGIPILSETRDETHPMVIAGGHATFNPEPMVDFIDAFVIGEGEDVILEIIEILRETKSESWTKPETLSSFAKLWGVYVPSLYDTHDFDDGTLSHIETINPAAQLPINKRIVPVLPPPPTEFVVPYIDVTHNRIPVEIMRGCTRGCRFCQAGMITRPVRERPVGEILDAIEASIDYTGFDEVGLLSLSSSDYDEILELVRAVRDRFVGQHLNISLPSLRIESFSVELMDVLQETSRRGGFTLAPEAATERMREIINKFVPTDQVLKTAREIYSRGWHTIKLYFMIGHPSETLEDVRAIAELCKAVLAVGREEIGMRAKVHAGVSTFVPKPHTPFQWVPCDSRDQIEAKQTLLKKELRGKGLKLNWTDPRETMLEAWLSRGDRKMGQVIRNAWELGARFDAWKEHFQFDLWMEAFDRANLDYETYTHRERPLDETHPWDHINAGVRKEFLTEDYLWSLENRTRVDCRERCFACGILPMFADLRRDNPGDVWECPEVRSPRRKRDPAFAVLST
jgi:radical SAM family uncharacterized protein